MISNVSVPSKSELIRNLHTLRNPIIETYEVFSKDEYKSVVKSLDTHLRKSNVSVIIIRER